MKDLNTAEPMSLTILYLFIGDGNSDGLANRCSHYGRNSRDSREISRKRASTTQRCLIQKSSFAKAQ
jgi:hypothetical protein